MISDDHEPVLDTDQHDVLDPAHANAELSTVELPDPSDGDTDSPEDFADESEQKASDG